jgi:hypothetical protein
MRHACIRDACAVQHQLGQLLQPPNGLQRCIGDAIVAAVQAVQARQL